MEHLRGQMSLAGSSRATRLKLGQLPCRSESRTRSEPETSTWRAPQECCERRTDRVKKSRTGRPEDAASLTAKPVQTAPRPRGPKHRHMKIKTRETDSPALVQIAFPVERRLRVFETLESLSFYHNFRPLQERIEKSLR